MGTKIKQILISILLSIVFIALMAASLINIETTEKIAAIVVGCMILISIPICIYTALFDK